jgi:hypothetical protein
VRSSITSNTAMPMPCVRDNGDKMTGNGAQPPERRFVNVRFRDYLIRPLRPAWVCAVRGGAFQWVEDPPGDSLQPEATSTKPKDFAKMSQRTRRPLKVGFVVPVFEPDSGNVPRWNEIRAAAQHAEAAGFDSLWVPDHLIFDLGDPDRPPRGVWECWSILSSLAAVTTRIDLFEACSAFTRVAACTLARPPIRGPLYRRLQPFRSAPWQVLRSAPGRPDFVATRLSRATNFALQHRISGE